MQLYCSSVNRLYPANALPSPHIPSYTFFPPTPAPETEGQVPARGNAVLGVREGDASSILLLDRGTPGLGRQTPSKPLPLLCYHFFSFLSSFLSSFLALIFFPCFHFCSVCSISNSVCLASGFCTDPGGTLPWGTPRDGKPKYHSSS